MGSLKECVNKLIFLPHVNKETGNTNLIMIFTLSLLVKREKSLQQGWISFKFVA